MRGSGRVGCEQRFSLALGSGKSSLVGLTSLVDIIESVGMMWLLAS